MIRKEDVRSNSRCAVFMVGLCRRDPADHNSNSPLLHTLEQLFPITNTTDIHSYSPMNTSHSSKSENVTFHMHKGK